eukprot:PLAT14310.1.p1 GENE.PLAT14310.1~~PLAT14310.1.p1  ORF type:complete len:431 (-),score=156.36 PLAT14310.1:156-1373(-)
MTEESAGCPVHADSEAKIEDVAPVVAAGGGGCPMAAAGGEKDGGGDSSGEPYYRTYLSLDSLLGSQKLASEAAGHAVHDEHLFIVIHQTYELWFKQIIYELNSVIDLFSGDYVPEPSVGLALSRLKRVTEIQRLLADQLTVLETMKPASFLEFRDYISPASGFQSYQFRIIENTLGLQRSERLNYNRKPYTHVLDDEDTAKAESAETSATIFSVIESWLERTPFLQTEGFDFWAVYHDSVMAMLEEQKEALRASSEPGEALDAQLAEVDKSIAHYEAVFDSETYETVRSSGKFRLSYAAMKAALFITLYNEEPILQTPHQLLVTLIEIDELFTFWRHRHALMAHRMLGVRVGTGGSSGFHYLRAAAERHKVFNDLYNLSTFLIPRPALPELPSELVSSLRFAVRA